MQKLSGAINFRPVNNKLFLQLDFNPIYPMINPKDLLIIYGISGLS